MNSQITPQIASKKLLQKSKSQPKYGLESNLLVYEREKQQKFHLQKLTKIRKQKVAKSYQADLELNKKILNLKQAQFKRVHTLNQKEKQKENEKILKKLAGISLRKIQTQGISFDKARLETYKKHKSLREQKNKMQNYELKKQNEKIAKRLLEKRQFNYGVFKKKTLAEIEKHNQVKNNVQRFVSLSNIKSSQISNRSITESKLPGRQITQSNSTLVSSSSQLISQIKLTNFLKDAPKRFQLLNSQNSPKYQLLKNSNMIKLSSLPQSTPKIQGQQFNYKANKIKPIKTENLQQELSRASIFSNSSSNQQPETLKLLEIKNVKDEQIVQKRSSHSSYNYTQKSSTEKYQKSQYQSNCYSNQDYDYEKKNSMSSIISSLSNTQRSFQSSKSRTNSKKSSPSKQTEENNLVLQEEQKLQQNLQNKLSISEVSSNKYKKSENEINKSQQDNQKDLNEKSQNEKTSDSKIVIEQSQATKYEEQLEQKRSEEYKSENEEIEDDSDNNDQNENETVENDDKNQSEDEQENLSEDEEESQSENVNENEENETEENETEENEDDENQSEDSDNSSYDSEQNKRDENEQYEEEEQNSNSNSNDGSSDGSSDCSGDDEDDESEQEESNSQDDNSANEKKIEHPQIKNLKSVKMSVISEENSFQLETPMVNQTNKR